MPYGDVREEIPDDCPTPLGNPVITTTWVDANLYHNFMTRRSVTGIVHVLNQTDVNIWIQIRGRTHCNQTNYRLTIDPTVHGNPCLPVSHVW